MEKALLGEEEVVCKFSEHGGPLHTLNVLSKTLTAIYGINAFINNLFDVNGSYFLNLN